MKPRSLLATAVIGFAAATHLNAVVTITKQPADQVVSLGAHVTNVVTATSTAPPLTYQWWGKGAILTDQTSRTLVLQNIQVAQAGEYYVVASDADNQPVQSDTATVTVDATFEKLTDGPLVTDVEPTENSTWWDYDNDGDLDVIVHVAAILGPGVSQSLYQNNGDGTFLKITTNAVAQTMKRALIGAVGDYDNDGDQDLYLNSNAWQAAEPKDDLFRNDGNGRFAALADSPWTKDLDHTFDCTFVDVDQDGLLDIFVVNVSQPPCLYRQTVAGTFTKLTAAQVGSLLGNPGLSYNAAWVDYDNDGDLDLWMENYQGRTRLHRNDGKGLFSLATPVSFAQSPGGFGVWADFDNDGVPELFIGGDTEGGARPNALYRRAAGQDFTNVAVEAGVAVTMTAWASAAAGDYDNDGWLDIFAADWEGTRPNVLFHNRRDGTFERVDVGSPIRDGDQRLGVRWVDYDNDGFVDLFMTCGTADGTTTYPRLNHLYRNNGRASGNANHWLKVKLNGVASNRSGIGAKIRVKATIAGKEVWQVREMMGNGYSQTCPGLVAHLGLGDATQVDVVRVEWPSGNVQEFIDVPPDQVFPIHEAVGIAPPRPSASLGGSVTLTAQRNGSYQWFHEDVALAGQQGQSLTLDGITANEAGGYSVVVVTGTGTFTNHVYLQVDSQFTRIEMGSTEPSWGCAWGDYNNDGYPDLFVAEGASTATAACSLYRNNRDGTFTLVTPDEAGDIVRLARNWWCPAWGDYDNDGQLDLFVTVGNDFGPALPVLWRNQGNGRFVEATDAGSFVEDDLWCAPIWGDYNRDGLLDLFVANAFYEPPRWDDHNALYLNDGHGRFRGVTDGELRSYRGQLQGGSAGDMDGDGDLDLLLTGSTGAALFENDGAGGFHRVTAGFPSVPGFPLIPSWADYDNDGRLDVFVAVYADAPTSQLLHNEGNGRWTSIPLGAALQTTAGMWADYDNDGDLDLFISRGQVTTTSNLLFANNGDGTFTQVTFGSLANDQGRAAGCAWADYDNNGFLDLFVTSHPDFPEVLYRNHGNGNRWVSFKLAGTRSNRSAIGAKVRVQARIFGKTYWQMREIGGGNRHQNDLRPHFGLGDAAGAIAVRVEWPSGVVQELANVTADQILTVWEPPFLRAAMLPNGACQLTISAEPNRAWRVEASNDLRSWEPLATETHPEVSFQYTDTTAASAGQRFYRIAEP